MEEKPLTPESNSVEFTPKSSAQRFIIAFIIVIVFIVIGTAFYFLGKAQNIKMSTVSPTTTPTSLPPQTTTWKTYSNEKYNYTINYPSDWAASEYPDSKDGASFNDAISISVGQKLGNYIDLTLEEYAKIAGKEIQNYDTLASIKKVTASSGTVGYETTWMVQPIAVMGKPPTASASESLPITYFAIPSDKSSLVRVMLDKKEDLATYERMLSSVKIGAPLTPIPTVDEESVLKYVIKKYIALKHSGDESALTITVSKIEGNYAQGGASDEGGGGMWFAAKEEGVWKLVWDGNGAIECSTFSLYPNFPISMIPECYDAVKQDVVKR